MRRNTFIACLFLLFTGFVLAASTDKVVADNPSNTSASGTSAEQSSQPNPGPENKKDISQLTAKQAREEESHQLYGLRKAQDSPRGNALSHSCAMLAAAKASPIL